MSTPMPGINYAPDIEPPYLGPESFMDQMICFCVVSLLKPLYVEPTGLAPMPSFDWDAGFKKIPTSAQDRREQYNKFQQDARLALKERYTLEGNENRRIRTETDEQNKRTLTLVQGINAARLAAKERIDIGVFTMD